MNCSPSSWRILPVCRSPPNYCGVAGGIDRRSDPVGWHRTTRRCAGGMWIRTLATCFEASLPHLLNVSVAGEPLGRDGCLVAASDSEQGVRLIQPYRLMASPPFRGWRPPVAWLWRGWTEVNGPLRHPPIDMCFRQGVWGDASSDSPCRRSQAGVPRANVSGISKDLFRSEYGRRWRPFAETNSLPNAGAPLGFEPVAVRSSPVRVRVSRRSHHV